MSTSIGVEYVPTEVFSPILNRLLLEYDDDAIEVISTKTGIPWDTIFSIGVARRPGVDFDVVDRLLCAMNATHLWWVDPLKRIYDSIVLTEKCARDGCSVSFVPHGNKRTGKMRQRYCSRRCGQMEHLKQIGKIQHSAKKNLKQFCRNGHRRTDENTAADGACRECERVQGQKRRDSLTPEQREARRAYQRDYYLKKKAA